MLFAFVGGRQGENTVDGAFSALLLNHNKILKLKK